MKVFKKKLFQRLACTLGAVLIGAFSVFTAFDFSRSKENEIISASAEESVSDYLPEYMYYIVFPEGFKLYCNIKETHQFSGEFAFFETSGSIAMMSSYKFTFLTVSSVPDLDNNDTLLFTMVSCLLYTDPSALDDLSLTFLYTFYLPFYYVSPYILQLLDFNNNIAYFPCSGELLYYNGSLEVSLPSDGYFPVLRVPTSAQGGVGGGATAEELEQVRQDGYNEGYTVGTANGYDYGYDVGYDYGYENGVDDGYGYGYDIGVEDGIAEGETIGYNKGVEAAHEYSFLNLFTAVVDAPIKTFLGILDFEILGMDMSKFFLSILTAALCIAVFRLFSGSSA